VLAILAETLPVVPPPFFVTSVRTRAGDHAMIRSLKCVCLRLLASTVCFMPAAARAANCAQTSTGLIPLTDLHSGLYLGVYEGGLYPGGANVAPVSHDSMGRMLASAIEPLSTAGSPDPGGKYVLLSIGMSNTTQEFCSAAGTEPCDPWTFMGQAASHPSVNRSTLVIVNGARGGQTATMWDSPADPNYNMVRDSVLAPKGLSEAQVVAAWVKVANARPTQGLPSAGADALQLEASIGNIARAAKTRYPNLRLVFLSSRIYAGYASTALNPEPYAYESGFSVKWAIQAQIDQMNAGGGLVDPQAGDLNYTSVAPWLGWGAYLWADGLIPRSDGLTYVCSDLAADGTHPATTGEQKVARLLLRFFLLSPYAYPWFSICRPFDMDGNGVVNGGDLQPFVEVLLNPAGATPVLRCAADANADGYVTAADVPGFVNALLQR